MNNIYATPETIDLLTCQQKTFAHKKLNPLHFNEQFKITSQSNDDITIKLIPSGHILGSASVLIEFQGERILFSSDLGGPELQTIKNPQETIDADYLVIEATFGSSNIQFPSRQKITMDLLKWTTEVIQANEIPVFTAGKIGSAQEIIKIINDYTNLRVLTHGIVTEVSKVYQKHNISLDFIDTKASEGREILRDGETIVILPRGKKIIPYFIKEHHKCRTAIASGMTALYPFSKYDASFPLSSHANYQELINYIEKVSPEKVYTMYGRTEEFARLVAKRLDIPAQSLKRKMDYILQRSPSSLRMSKNKFERSPIENNDIFGTAMKNNLPTKSLKELKDKKTKTLDSYFTKEKK
jgi:putative mRNA 3-end processing factor